MDNQTTQPEQNNWKRNSTVICLTVVLILCALLWLYFVPDRQKNELANNSGSLATSTRVSDFKRYDAVLPPQFPKDFPNPVKGPDVISSQSMTLNDSLPVKQSVFKFSTKTSVTDILKLYRDYLIKNAWVIKSSPSSASITAIKNSSVIGIMISEQAANIVTLSISNIEGAVKVAPK